MDLFHLTSIVFSVFGFAIGFRISHWRLRSYFLFLFVGTLVIWIMRFQFEIRISLLVLPLLLLVIQKILQYRSSVDHLLPILDELYFCALDGSHPLNALREYFIAHDLKKDVEWQKFYENVFNKQHFGIDLSAQRLSNILVHSQSLTRDLSNYRREVQTLRDIRRRSDMVMAPIKAQLVTLVFVYLLLFLYLGVMRMVAANFLLFLSMTLFMIGLGLFYSIGRKVRWSC